MPIEIINRNLRGCVRGAVICLFPLFLFSCSSKPAANRQSVSAVPVNATKVITKEMPVEISTIGNFAPVISVSVKPQVSGRLLKVNFKEGDFVKKGQLLFTIDSRPFIQSVKQATAGLGQSMAGLKVAEANLASARSQLGGARSNVLNQQAGVSSAQGNLNSLKAESDDALSLLKKQQALQSEGIIAERDLEVAQTSYKSALAKYQQALAQVNQAQVVARSAASFGIDQAQSVIQQMQSQIQASEALIGQNQAEVDNAKIQLGYCQITSPIDGRTGDLNITLGNVISPNDASPLVTIDSMSPIYATFSVPEKYLADIQKYSASGVLRVAAQIDAETSRIGTLSSLDNEVNQTTGTVRLKASFLNDDGLLFPGRYVNIVLTLTDEPNAIVVPASAIQTSQQGQFVYVIKGDQTVEMRKVVLDRSIGNDTVISDGLKEGEMVVTDGQLKVSPGALVQITSDPQTTSQSNPNGVEK
ncbi:MAG: efflux RND transporter periplasmic adaptor subunit [Acidobacteriota bacterium]